MSKDLFSEIVSDDNMYCAYRKTQRGNGKYKKDAILFAKDETENLKQLQKELIEGTYQFGRYEAFTVYEPKERIINAPKYRDKIVQIAINNVIKEIYNPCFIYDSYASIDNKGTHKSADRIQHFMRKAKWMYGESVYIIKIDVKKFFYSIDRDILKHLLSLKIECRKTLYLLFKIIDSAATIDIIGLPLGNTLSQICANIMMNQVDQYAKRVLGLKFYVRYMDDIIIIEKSKEDAERTKDLVCKRIESINLMLNETKTSKFPLRQGVNAVGFKIHPTHKLLRNGSKKKIKRKTRKMKRLLVEGRLTKEKAEQMLNSWKGHADNGNSHTFINKLVEKNRHIFMNEKGTLKIKEAVLC